MLKALKQQKVEQLSSQAEVQALTGMPAFCKELEYVAL